MNSFGLLFTYLRLLALGKSHKPINLRQSGRHQAIFISQQQLYTRIDKSSSLKCKSIYQTRLFVVCHGRTVNGDWLGRGRINIMTTWIWCEPVCCWYYYYFYLEANLEYDLISKLEKDVEEQIVLYKLDSSSSSSLPPSSSWALCLTTNSAHSVVRWYHSRTGC